MRILDGIATNSYGPANPRTARLMLEYAAVLRRLKRKREAEQAERILTENARRNGAEHMVDVSVLRAR